MSKHEGAGNRDIAAAWARRAEDLAEWTWSRLVHRADVWGAYLPLHLRTPTRSIYTAPARAKRGQVFLSKAIIARHYAGRDPGALIGLHSTSPDNTSLAGAVDIDCHGETSSRPEANLAAAVGWYAKLAQLGFQPLLTASNGKGGYHLRTLFRAPVPTAQVFAFLRWLIRDYAYYGLPTPPETFPKQARIDPGRHGNWLRLPGQHHTRDYWSQVWDGQAWLAGAPAVEFLLSLYGSGPALLPFSLFPSGSTPGQATVAASPQSCQACTPANADRDLSAWIAAYAAKLPHRGQGQHRDDIAYTFAAFLVRDLELPDDQALPWLERWDAGNRPPKGKTRLQEILANAHAYGKHAYGSGKNRLGLTYRRQGKRYLCFRFST